MFYSLSDNKIFVSTNVRFLEDDYIKNTKPQNRLILEELSGEESLTPQRENISQPIIIEMQIETEPMMRRHSRRVVR